LLSTRKGCTKGLVKPLLFVLFNNVSRYNYCLHMRWTSKVVNLRVVVFYDGFNQSENNLSRVDNLMFTSYMNTLNYFIIPKLLKVVYYLNLLFCRRLQNNFWKKIYNYRTGLKKNIQLQNRTEKKYTITEPDWKKIYNYRTVIVYFFSVRFCNCIFFFSPVL
jgi:ABC-type antimicrobial peptide transport system permease subunit